MYVLVMKFVDLSCLRKILVCHEKGDSFTEPMGTHLYGKFHKLIL
jgi:hypothetical protein